MTTTPKTPNMTDYEAERRNFHLDVPAQFNFAIDVMGKWASDPNKLAMLWVGQNGEEKHIRSPSSLNGPVVPLMPSQSLVSKKATA